MEVFMEKWAEGGKILVDLLEDVVIEFSKVFIVLC